MSMNENFYNLTTEGPKVTAEEHAKLAQEVCMESSWGAISWSVVKALGIEAAIMLAALSSRQHYLHHTEMLRSDMTFVATVDAIKSMTTLNKDAQARALDRLKRAGILTYARKGSPPRRTFTINVNRLHDIVKSVNAQNQNMQLQPTDCDETTAATAVNPPDDGNLRKSGSMGYKVPELSESISENPISPAKNLSNQKLKENSPKLCTPNVPEPSYCNVPEPSYCNVPEPSYSYNSNKQLSNKKEVISNNSSLHSEYPQTALQFAGRIISRPTSSIVNANSPTNASVIDAEGLNPHSADASFEFTENHRATSDEIVAPVDLAPKKEKAAPAKKKSGKGLTTVPRSKKTLLQKTNEFITMCERQATKADFSPEVQKELGVFFRMLAQKQVFMPYLAIEGQLSELSKVPPAKQVEVIKTTVTRGWNSLDYVAKQMTDPEANYAKRVPQSSAASRSGPVNPFDQITNRF